MDAALGYATKGWPVFPCHGVTAAGCSCRTPDCASPGKHPRVARGLNSASTDRAQITRWWERSPSSNIGVRTGAESGLVVLDVDTVHGGSRSIKALIDRHGELSSVPRVRTGSGGWHLFFAHPGEPVRNSAGLLGPGLDIRGDGGYVIAPPSVHASGGHYRWEVDAASLPPLPDWLFALLSRPRDVVPARQLALVLAGRDTTSWARAALDAEIRGVCSALKGSRNMTLNRAAFCLGQIVGAGLLDQHSVEGLLVDAGVSIGVGERETIMTVRSGMRAGIDHPRGPAAAPIEGPHRAIATPDLSPEIG